jgi:hypothetical protein
MLRASTTSHLMADSRQTANLPIRWCRLHIADGWVGRHPTEGRRLISDGLSRGPGRLANFDLQILWAKHHGANNLDGHTGGVFPTDEIEWEKKLAFVCEFQHTPLLKIISFSMFFLWMWDLIDIYLTHLETRLKSMPIQKRCSLDLQNSVVFLWHGEINFFVNFKCYDLANGKD